MLILPSQNCFFLNNFVLCKCKKINPTGTLIGGTHNIPCCDVSDCDADVNDIAVYSWIVSRFLPLARAGESWGLCANHSIKLFLKGDKNGKDHVFRLNTHVLNLGWRSIPALIMRPKEGSFSLIIRALQFYSDKKYIIFQIYTLYLQWKKYDLAINIA